MANFTHDVVILGGGPGGIRAAEVLAHAGKKVALVSTELGGECLNYGCIPTKTYLWSVELLEKIASAKTCGIEVSAARIDWHALQARRTYVVTKLKRVVLQTLQRIGVEIIEGIGRFSDPHTIDISALKRTVSASYLIIATGSYAYMPKEFTDSENFLTNKEILDLPNIPESLLIIGAGAVGVEFASVFAALGSAVTLAEAAERILPAEDSEVSAEVERVFVRKKITIHKGVHVTIADTQEYEKILVATGRKALVEGIGFETAGVKVTPKGIETNDVMCTNVPHIFAIGDVAGKAMLAYTAKREGEIAAAFILGQATIPLDYSIVPNTIFSLPEVASCGLTEDEAKKRGLDYVVGKAMAAANAKGLILDSRDGFAKVIAEKKSGEFLGFHIVGEKATELIAQASLALQSNMTIQKFSEHVYGHPTLCEILKEAVYNSLNI